MHAEDVLGDEAVALLVDIVGDDKEQIETGEKRVGEGDVLVGILVHVVLAEDGVGGSDDRAASVERGVDSGLGNGDGLLLHDFVDGDTIDLGHLVKLVDAHDSAISEDHGSSFETTLACEREGRSA